MKTRMKIFKDLDIVSKFLPGPSEPGPSNEDANEDKLLRSDGEFESG